MPAALLVVPALLAGGGIGYVASEPQIMKSFLTALPEQRAACDIKGNINARGEHIYHLPGDTYYDETRIDAARGERWFCSESEARAAGWRHAKV